jgi:hypothetical protein
MRRKILVLLYDWVASVAGEGTVPGSLAQTLSGFKLPMFCDLCTPNVNKAGDVSYESS